MSSVIAHMAGAEPVAAQHRFRHPQKNMPGWSVWQPCAVSDRPKWEVDSQGYEVEYRNLYTHPPARVPLTEDEIDKLPWGPHEGNPLTFAEGLRDFARAVIAAYEAKNGIGGGK